jgi:molybdenum cofactor biosynthesis enzyme MoaA
MTDPFGRIISYLRVSVTDRCDLRGFYCMSEEMTFLPKADLLSLESQLVHSKTQKRGNHRGDGGDGDQIQITDRGLDEKSGE